MVVSFRPLHHELETLLFGVSTTVFSRDMNGRERLVDRELKMRGSGAQDGTFVGALEDVVVERWAF